MSQAAERNQALDSLARDRFAAVLTGVRIPGPGGAGAFRRLRTPCKAQPA